MGKKSVVNAPLSLREQLVNIELVEKAYSEEETKLAKKKFELEQAKFAVQRELEATGLTAKDSYDKRMVRLAKQIRELKAYSQDSSRARSFGRFHAVVGDALEAFCSKNHGRACSYDGLDYNAKLVEETLAEAKKDKPNFDVLNEKFKAIEEKARDLEGSKHIFKRKLAKALLGVGIVLALGAAVTLILSFTPVMLPVLVTAGFGAMFGINVAVTISLVVGAAMTKINFDRLRSSSLSTTMPLLSQSLFKLRDTIKDVTEGRDPKDVSWVRQIARSNR